MSPIKYTFKAEVMVDERPVTISYSGDWGDSLPNCAFGFIQEVATLGGGAKQVSFSVFEITFRCCENCKNDHDLGSFVEAANDAMQRGRFLMDALQWIRGSQDPPDPGTLH